jgi:sec-independent protein translocase protein TatA
MLGNLNGWHLVIILAVVLLLFGAPKLPGLARSIGQSMRIFRSEVKTMKDENGDDVVVDSVDVDDDVTTTAKPAKASTTKPASSKPKP